MRLDATELTASERALQQEVHDWLDERLPPGSYEPGLGMAGAIDRDFSRDLGARGWLGMSLPTEFGGHGRTAVDRLVVVEALLLGALPSAITGSVTGRWAPASQPTGPNSSRRSSCRGSPAASCPS